MTDLPRDNLFRSAPAFEMRADEPADGEKPGMPTMVVNFARFNEFTEINSIFEGRFLEQIAPGAFKKTFREQRDQIRPIFQHGRDPIAGDKPLGPVEDLREENGGAWGYVPLLDADYVRQIVPGLEAGVYGASFAFQVLQEDIVQEPKRSDANPDGLPERTIKEVRLREFGPVTYPAYASASAGIRSLTDEFTEHDPVKLRELADRIEALTSVAAERAITTITSDDHEPAISPLVAARIRHGL
jgi:HK97 family phage prohead protease